jgi:hypothetical protein
MRQKSKDEIFKLANNAAISVIAVINDDVNRDIEDYIEDNGSITLDIIHGFYNDAYYRFEKDFENCFDITASKLSKEKLDKYS